MSIVAYYTFNNGSLEDYSGNGYTAKAIDIAYDVNYNAYKQNITTGCIELPRNISNDINTTNIVSIEFDVYLLSYSAIESYGSTVLATNTNYGIWITVDNTGKLRVSLFNDLSTGLLKQIPESNTPLNTWMNYKITGSKGGAFNVFENGQLIHTGTSENTQLSGTLTIGDLRSGRKIGLDGYVKNLKLRNSIEINDMCSIYRGGLKTHIPFISNQKDLTGNYTITKYNSTIDPNGKLGSCHVGESYISSNQGLTYIISDGKPFSICMWFCANGLSANQNYLVNCGRASTSNNLHIDIRNNRLYYGFYGDDMPGIINIIENKWYHMVFIYDGLSKHAYIDGVLDNSKISGQLNTGESNFTIGKSCIKYNDFRIYDYAISFSEISVLSKAKVLHYKFNDFQESIDNIAKSYNGYYFTSAFDGANYGFGDATNITRGIDNSDQPIKNSDVQKVSRILSGKSHLDYVSWDSCFSHLQIEPNEIYTFSFLFKGTYGSVIYPYINSATTIKIRLNEKSSWTTGINIPVEENKWNNIEFQLTNVGAVATNSWAWMNLHSNASTAKLSTNEFWKITGVMFEKKTYRSLYSPGTIIGKIRDCSNNGYNTSLPISSTPKWSVGKNHTGCYDLDKGKSINTTLEVSPFTNVNSKTTLCGWFKLPILDTNRVYNICVCGWAAYSGLCIYINKYNEVGGYYRNTNMQYDVPAKLITDMDWHHVALVLDLEKGVLNLNVDGKLHRSINVVYSPKRASDNIFNINNSSRPLGGDSSILNPMRVMVDDIRLYASALSIDDIINIYNEPICNIYGTNVGDIVKPNLKSNILDYSAWTPQKKVARVGQFKCAATSVENDIVVDLNPWGRPDIMWKGWSKDIDSNDEGGFFATPKTNLDTTKKYRFSVWVKKGPNGNGRIYLGPEGRVLELSGSANSNKYFSSYTQTEIPEEYRYQWNLFVGYIHESTYNGATLSTSGIYGLDGVMFRSCSDCKFSTNSVIFRTFMYYSTATDDYTLFYRPRIDLIDGTEPSISDLLSGIEHGEFIDKNVKVLSDKGVITTSIGESFLKGSQSAPVDINIMVDDINVNGAIVELSPKISGNNVKDQLGSNDFVIPIPNRVTSDGVKLMFRNNGFMRRVANLIPKSIFFKVKFLSNNGFVCDNTDNIGGYTNNFRLFIDGSSTTLYRARHTTGDVYINGILDTTSTQDHYRGITHTAYITCPEEYIATTPQFCIGGNGAGQSFFLEMDLYKFIMFDTYLAPEDIKKLSDSFSGKTVPRKPVTMKSYYTNGKSYLATKSGSVIIDGDIYNTNWKEINRGKLLPRVVPSINII